MKVAYVGDTHGNITNVINVLQHCKSNGVEEIIQVGDFGHFPRFEGLRSFTEDVSKLAVESGIHFSWTHGNHDDLEDLARYKQPTVLFPNLTYYPSGTTMNINGNTILFVGGAYSIDRAYRTKGVDIWPELEVLSYLQVMVFASVKADIIVSHDAPSSVSFSNLIPIPEAYSNRIALEHIFQEVKPKYLIHGHYHRSYECLVKKEDFQCQFVGLDCDYSDISKQVKIFEL